MKKILIIEDDKQIKKAMVEKLKSEYVVESIDDFKSIYAFLKSMEYDLIILDLTLKDINGREVYSIIKKNNISSKIIIYTSDNSGQTELDFLKKGVDDYLKKPLDLDILHFRIKQMLDIQKFNIEYKDLIFDREKLIINGKVKLTKNEALVLSYLMSNPNQEIPVKTILLYLWDNNEFYEKSAFAMTLTRIRKKIFDANSKVEIKSLRNKGVILK